MASAALYLEFTTLTCCDCGVPFTVQAVMVEQWKQRGDLFYCPRGHSQWFSDGDGAKFKQEIAALTAKVAAAEKRAAVEAQWRKETEAAVFGRAAEPRSEREIAGKALGRDKLTGLSHSFRRLKQTGLIAGDAARGWVAVHPAPTNREPQRDVDATILRYLRSVRRGGLPWKALAKKYRQQRDAVAERLRVEVQELQRRAEVMDQRTLPPARDAETVDGGAAVLPRRGRGTPCL